MGNSEQNSHSDETFNVRSMWSWWIELTSLWQTQSTVIDQKRNEHGWGWLHTNCAKTKYISMMEDMINHIIYNHLLQVRNKCETSVKVTKCDMIQYTHPGRAAKSI